MFQQEEFCINQIISSKVTKGAKTKLATLSVY